MEKTPTKINARMYKYALTWSPRPLYRVTNVKKQFQIYMKMICGAGIYKCLDLALVCELNLSGNAHFHGSFNIVDPLEWYKTVLPLLKNQGFIKIKEIDSDGWDDYIRKDNHYMTQILGITLPLLRNPFKPIMFKGEGGVCVKNQ